MIRPAPGGSEAHRPTRGGTTSELVVGGTREIPAFLGPRGRAIFACLHLPAATAPGLVVVCPSFGAEWKYNYRREVLLARDLAQRGIAVVRFQYLGSGHSDDGIAPFGQMVHDALLAENWARQRAGTRKVAFFGARFGAMVAAAAGRPAASAVATWSPPTSGQQYFDEIFRVVRIGRLGHPAVPGEEPHDDRAALARGEAVDLLGYTLPAELYRSLEGSWFERELGARPREVALMDVGERRSRHLDETATRLRTAGYRISLDRLEEGRSWWLHDSDWQPDEERESVRRLVSHTSAWLLQALLRHRGPDRSQFTRKASPTHEWEPSVGPLVVGTDASPALG